MTEINGNWLVVDTSNGEKTWHVSDCVSVRDASAFATDEEDDDPDEEKE